MKRKAHPKIRNEKLTTILQETIRKANQGKITIENSWDFPIFTDNFLKRAIDGRSFQENSITVDTATKVYRKRVESVHIQCLKILSSRNLKKKKSTKRKVKGNISEEEVEKKKRKVCANTLCSDDDKLLRDESEFIPKFDSLIFRNMGDVSGDVSSLLVNILFVDESGKYLIEEGNEFIPSERSEESENIHSRLNEVNNDNVLNSLKNIVIDVDIRMGQSLQTTPQEITTNVVEEDSVGLYDLGVEEFEGSVGDMGGDVLGLDDSTEDYHENVVENTEKIGPKANNENVDISDDYSYFLPDYISKREDGVLDWTGYNNVFPKRRNVRKKTGLRKKEKVKRINWEIDKNLLEIDVKKKVKLRKKKKKYLLPEDFNIKPLQFTTMNNLNKRKIKSGYDNQFRDYIDGGGDIGMDVTGESFPDVDLVTGPEVPFPDYVGSKVESSFDDMEPISKKRRLTIERLLMDNDVFDYSEGLSSVIDEVNTRVMKGFKYIDAPTNVINSEGVDFSHIGHRVKSDIGVLKNVIWENISSRSNDGGISFQNVFENVKRNEETRKSSISECFISVLHLSNEKNLALSTENLKNFIVKIQ